jgi:hypothetical protein
MNAVKNAWTAYCNGNYEMNKAVYEAGLILM